MKYDGRYLPLKSQWKCILVFDRYRDVGKIICLVPLSLSHSLPQEFFLAEGHPTSPSLLSVSPGCDGHAFRDGGGTWHHSCLDSQYSRRKQNNNNKNNNSETSLGYKTHHQYKALLLLFHKLPSFFWVE